MSCAGECSTEDLWVRVPWREPYLENTSLYSPKEGRDGFALFFLTQEQRLNFIKRKPRSYSFSSILGYTPLKRSQRYKMWASLFKDAWGMAVLLGLCTTCTSALCAVHRAVPACLCTRPAQGPCDCSVMLSRSSLHSHRAFCDFCNRNVRALIFHFPPARKTSSKYTHILSPHVCLDLVCLSKRPSPNTLPQVWNSKALITLPRFAATVPISKHAVYTVFLIVVGLLPRLEGKHPEDRNFVLGVVYYICRPQKSPWNIRGAQYTFGEWKNECIADGLCRSRRPMRMGHRWGQPGQESGEESHPRKGQSRRSRGRTEDRQGGRAVGRKRVGQQTRPVAQGRASVRPPPNRN